MAEARPHWPIGTILKARYSVGYWPRCYYVRVIGYTKSGAPRVELLDEEIVSEWSTPCDSNTCHRLRLPPVPHARMPGQFVARWRKKDQCWGIVVDRYKPRLEPHEEGSTFNEPCYG